jgi:uncharacterized protein YndB with AHSA1/START domain
MIDFTLQTRIDRPATNVFAYVTDPGRLATWQTNTVSAVQEGDGPLGLGTRLREVHRGPGGKEFASVVEVSEFEPGRVFALRVLEGTPVHLRITLTPTDGGTDVGFRAHGPIGGLKRVVLGRILRRQFAAQLATLKSVLEELEPVAERVA